LKLRATYSEVGLRRLFGPQQVCPQPAQAGFVLGCPQFQLLGTSKIPTPTNPKNPRDFALGNYYD